MSSNDIFSELFERYPALGKCEADIYRAYTVLKKCYDGNGKVLACGNGGSAADADHIVGELMKGFLLGRKINDKALNGDDEILMHLQDALPAVSLDSHSALLTAFSNDLDFDYAYAQQVYGLGNAGDVLIALSTSGNSASVVNAVRAAGAKGVVSVGITGSKDSKMSEKCDVCIKLPETETFKIQELTLPVYHCLCAMLEADFFEN
ncbi:MAG: SIS domain-containing protein [Clostridia bacterium]|nr:SIS domain-containing protein [Clostridia bacterium]